MGDISTEHVVWQNRDEVLRICAAHGAGNVRVFGSVACGQAGPDSDVDLLVDIVGPTTQWWPGGLIVDLEKLLGISIDIATERALSKYMRDGILAEVIKL